MNVSYDTIVFDMDGVLVTGYETSKGVYQRATQSMLSAFGREKVNEAGMDLINPNGSEEFRLACERIAIPADAAWGYRERRSSELEHQRIDRGIRTPYSDTEILPTLSKQCALGITSNNRHDTVRYCTEYFAWENVFDCVRGRFPTLTDYNRMKPNPTFLEWTIERLSGNTALFVGDRASDIQTAEQIGCDSALIVRNSNSIEGTCSPTHTIDTLDTLCELIGA